MNQNTGGGLSFDIQPSNAQVFIDGQYIGPVSTFSPHQAPLTVPAGRHHVEIRADGYRASSFDVDVVVGQVIPYQGAMQTY